MMVVMEDGDNEVHEPEIQENEEESDNVDTAVFTLKVLSVIHHAQQRHGLRHGDYQRYRSYCCRKIRRIRKMLHFVQGNRKNFRRKHVTDDVINNEKYLYIPLMNIERAWSYSMQLKQEANTEQRKRFHLLSRLRKAAKLSDEFQNLCENSARCDARTKLEVQAYTLYIRATLMFETRQWTEAMRFFTQSQAIYENLATALSEDEAVIYKAKADEMIPSLRFCAYSVGDKTAMEDLMQMNVGYNEMLATLLKETKSQQASALSQVTWRGRTVSVQHEKIRTFLMSEQKLQSTLEKCDDKLEVYETFLMECKDAINILREELRQDPTYKMYRSEVPCTISSAHYLYIYLSYIRIINTVQRNIIILDNSINMLDNKQKGSDGRKVRIQDIVRLCEIIVQNLQELPHLASLQNDEDIKMDVERQINVYSAVRCYYLCQGYINAELWHDALSLYSRIEHYINLTSNDSALSQQLKTRVASLNNKVQADKLTVYARSVISRHNLSKQMNKMKISDNNSTRKDLDQRLDDYDSGLSCDWLIDLPPSMQPVPCKPLFFDLALNHIQLPDLSQQNTQSAAANLTSQNESASAGGGGLTGLVRGLWGWGGSKK